MDEVSSNATPPDTRHLVMSDDAEILSSSSVCCLTPNQVGIEAIGSVEQGAKDVWGLSG